MQKDTLTFHLTPANRDEWDFKTSDAFSRKFIRSLGLKVHSGCWADIELDSPVIHEFIEKAGNLISAKKACFYGCCFMNQKLVEDSATPIEWYKLAAQKDLDYGSSQGLIETCKAYKMSPSVHVASGGMYCQYVSEKFKAVVEESGLTGIEFVWVKDTGKYKAPQWYIPMALVPMGRGVDHPWFNPKTLRGSDAYQPERPQWRTGVWHFNNKQIKKNMKFDNPIHSKIINLFGSDYLSINSYLRFLRAYVPDTDFAYTWKVENSSTDDWGNRDICLNRKARDILLEKNVVREEDLKPVQILDELPAGCQQLDEESGLPGPYYSQEQLERLKPELEKAWQKHLATEKPTRSVKIKEALKELRSAKRDRPGDFTKGTRKPDFGSLDKKIPEYWRDVLAISSGGDLCAEGECTIIPASEIKACYKEKKELVESLYDEYPFERDHIPIATSINGDWYSLESRKKLAEDSRVHRVSHEGCTIEDTWESIPQFVSDILAGFYE